MNKCLLFLILSLHSMFVQADPVQINGIYYNLNISTNEAEVSSHPTNNYTGEVTIPASIMYKGSTYFVTAIRHTAFFGCKSLKSISIPSCVTFIGEQAFYNCSSLTSIAIPNSVTSIGEEAFCNCSALTSITLSKSLTSISKQTFMGCSSLTSITIPNSVTSIEYEAFYGCNNLTTITIPNSVSFIGNEAFDSTPWYDNQPDGLLYIGKVVYKYKGTMPANTSITLKEGTTGITGIAFWNCSGLTTITIPNTVTSIGEQVFYDCSNLTSIIVDSGNRIYDSRDNCNAIIETANNRLLYGCKNTVIPNSVTSIGNSAFGGCKSITSIIIPNSVTSIGNQAFNGCSGLTSITIPNSVTTIGNYAFYGCSSLSSITIPNSVTLIGYEAFTNTPWYNKQPDGLVYAGKVAFKYKGTMPANTSITLKEGTKGIASCAFQGCKSLTSISIPNSVTTISNSAFQGCSGLTTITIPNSVKVIENGAFSSCSGLTSIIIPNSVTTIEYRVFSSCSSLTNVSIPSSVKYISDWAFNGCSSLTSITIPNSVTEIGKSAFANCSGLTSITLPSSITSIGSRAFSGCNTLKSITLPNNVTNIGEYAFYNCRSLTDVYCLAESLPTTEIYIFYNVPIKTATLYVPSSTLDFYSNTTPWSSFGKIVTIDVNSIVTGKEEIATMPMFVKNSDGVITVYGVGNNTEIKAYTTSGTLVGKATSANNTSTITTSLTPGNVVILNMGNKAMKVLMR